eukprot:PRCOL_00006869-RA
MATAGGGRAEADGAGGARGLRKRRAGTGSTVADAATATTLFVRGVPPEATHGMLEKAFSAVGPVREAFLVDDKFAGRHRGIGFIKFALAEDAKRALAESVAVGGKVVAVDVANKRGRIEEGKRRTLTPREEDPQALAHKERRRERREERDAAAKAKAARGGGGAARAEADDEVDADAVAQRAGGLDVPTAARTVVLGARTRGALTELAGRVRALAGCERKRVACPADERVLSAHAVAENAPRELEHFATATFESVTAARAAVEAVHEPPVHRWARQLGGEGAKARRWRVIVRNLAWAAREADVAIALSEGGFVWDVVIPTDAASGRRRGFAFACFTCRAHAERAIAKVNGAAICGRPVAVDWAVAKAMYLKAAGDAEDKDAGEGEGTAEKAGAGGDASDEDDDSALASDTDSDDSDGDGDDDNDTAAEGGDAMADLEREKSAMGSVLDRLLGKVEDHAEEGDAGGEEAGEEAEGGSGEEQDDGEADEDEDEAAANEADDRGDGKASVGAKGGKGDGQGASERGPPPWQRSRDGGDAISRTVFMRGVSLDATADDVKKALRQFGAVGAARLVTNKATGLANGTAFVEFGSEEAAKRCAAHARAMGGLLVAGARCDVNMAVRREDAAALAARKAAERGSKNASKGGDAKDRRNLYLAAEGAIPEDSPAHAEMSKQDADKRRRFAAEKKEKLRSPNFFVSTTRLSLRNLSAGVDEKTLKRLALEAVKARSSGAKPAIKQAKVLVDSERNGKDGKPRSRGAGFVEFGEHEHALACLRHLNNNPKVKGFTAERRPIVEFAIEDVRMLRKRAGRMAREKREGDKAREMKDGTQGAGREPKEPRVGRGKRQREAKRARRAEAEAAGGAAKGAEGSPSAAGGTGEGAPNPTTQEGGGGSGRRDEGAPPAKRAKAAPKQKGKTGGRPQQSAPQEGVRDKAKAQRGGDKTAANGTGGSEGAAGVATAGARAKGGKRKRDAPKAAAAVAEAGPRAAAPTASAKPAKKTRKSKKEQRDGLDDMVARYKKSFAGGDAGKAGSGGGAGGGGGLSRWFD